MHEFIRWRLDKHNISSRYHYQKIISYENVPNWLFSKSYIWLPSIAEGFNRSIMEGMLTGLKPIIHRYPGADELWPAEFIYDDVSDIGEILGTEYERRTIVTGKQM